MGVVLRTIHLDLIEQARRRIEQRAESEIKNVIENGAPVAVNCLGRHGNWLA